MKKLILVGYKTPIFSILDAAIENGYTVIGLLSNKYGKGETVDGVRVLGKIDDLLNNDAWITKLKQSADFFPIVTFHEDISNSEMVNKERSRTIDVLERSKVNIVTLISKLAHVHKSAIGKGVFIDAGAMVHRATIGDYTFVLPRATVHTNSTIGKNVYIGVQSFINTYTTIENGVVVGPGTMIIQNVTKDNNSALTIGENSILAPGLCIMTDIEPNSVVLNTSKLPRRVSHRLVPIINNDAI